MIFFTQRLILRPFTESDAGDLLEYLKDPSVNCFASMKITSIDEAKKIITKRMTNNDCFAIVLKQSGKVIGEIEGAIESTDPEQNDNDTVSPCWMLNETYRRNGYMFEALTAYYDYLFNDCGIRRIYIYTEDYNIACQKLCIKLGMRKEGEFKEFVSFVKDESGKPIYENTWQYAILKKEWESKR